MSEQKTESFVIAKEADAIIVTQTTRRFAEQHGFCTSLQSMIATSVSELSMNIVKYAGRGYVTIAIIQQADQVGLEIIAEDNGPGISDRVSALTDHMSTGGTLGLGLPGVKRLMDEFFIDCELGQGTKVVARKWKPL